MPSHHIFVHHQLVFCQYPTIKVLIYTFLYFSLHDTFHRMSWCSAKLRIIRVLCVFKADCVYMKAFFILCLQPVVIKRIREAFECTTT